MLVGTTNLMSSTSHAFPQATGGTYLGDAGSGIAPGPVSGVEAGAAGNSSGAMSLSTGGLIAIVVVVVVVSIIGVTTAVLFFIAKKREWTVRETIRRSTRKIAAAFTPRRGEFPDAVKRPTSPGLSRWRPAKLAHHAPPTPHRRPSDIEKGLVPAEGHKGVQ
ncbi:uncharacterized protein DCS_06879 [Drechmeria coniospora]|uniref:Uncharacterized protein n=1 Tax=Drechmeria coniospora TaxID=98403 RepID=A0A151GCT8_DRECN|nr:uncharacterized protein DCS_06879 [Drechmeria coniospora]KYK54918.1 uncharacterized protein DCS_06879 [Drechmeria coniospora]ODA75851.1 hypothetical protein RJ55_08492 [Drechmeria coniospora]